MSHVDGRRTPCKATKVMEKVVMDEPRVLKWMLCDHAGSTAASPSCQQDGFSRTVDWGWHRERVAPPR